MLLLLCLSAGSESIHFPLNLCEPCKVKRSEKGLARPENSRERLGVLEVNGTYPQTM